VPALGFSDDDTGRNAGAGAAVAILVEIVCNIE
jgi:hypothetical protein